MVFGLDERRKKKEFSDKMLNKIVYMSWLYWSVQFFRDEKQENCGV